MRNPLNPVRATSMVSPDSVQGNPLMKKFRDLIPMNQLLGPHWLEEPARPSEKPHNAPTIFTPDLSSTGAGLEA